MKYQVWSDIRRSVSVILAVVLLSGLFPSIDAAADTNGFQVSDSGKRISFYYCDDGVFGFPAKYVAVSNTESITINQDSLNNYSLTADVCYITADGNEIPIFSYVTDTDASISVDENDSIIFPLCPSYTLDNGSDYTPSMDTYYGCYLLPTWDSYYGLEQDFSDYLQFSDSNQLGTLADFFKTAGNNFQIKYTISDTASNQTETHTYTGYSAISWQVSGSYAYGYELGYNRIEDMNDYRNSNTYGNVKMYKGNLYVDAAKDSQNITLPNQNDTNCDSLNSIYVNEENIWNDNTITYSVTSGYNVWNIYPNTSSDINDALKNYFNIFYNNTSDIVPDDSTDSGKIAQYKLDALGIKISNDALEVSVGSGTNKKTYKLERNMYGSTMFTATDAAGNTLTTNSSLTSADALLNYLSNNYPDALSAFKKELLNQGLIVRNLTSGTKSNAVSKSGVSVSGDSISIPSTALDHTLGTDNVIWEYWYAGNFPSYLVPVFNLSANDTGQEGQTKILHYGYETTYNLLKATQFDVVPYTLIDNLYCCELANIIYAKVPDTVGNVREASNTAADTQTSQNEYRTRENSISLQWDTPNDNGAEIIGYQIAVVKRGSVPTDDDYTSSLQYSDKGDNYTISYTTADTSYTIDLNNESKDIYIRAVNVIGAGNVTKISYISENQISIEGPDMVKTGTTTNYNVIDVDENNIEEYFTYSIQDNPEKISIDDSGNLTVEKGCTLNSVTIIATGISGAYTNRTAEKEVSIISDSASTSPTPNPSVTPDVPDLPDTPDLPDSPDISNTTNPPDIPDTTDIPNSPDITPDIPDSLDSPDTPDTSGIQVKSPQTSDMESIEYLIILIILCAAFLGISGLICFRKKQKV